jgi:arabinofuranosyltransferase
MSTTATEEIEPPAPIEAGIEPRRVSNLERAGLIIGSILLIFFAFKVFGFIHDDAFITYRYSYNLRHGLGPVFNPGEHTEGYSCPLYMVMTTLLMFLPGDVLVRAKLLGVGFALAALWAAWRLARELELPEWARAAVPLFIGVNSSVAFSAIDGMETSFQMFLVTMAALTFVREQKAGSGIKSALWLLAVALNRAEGFLFFLAALIPFVLNARKAGFGQRERKWLAVFILPMTLFFVWRLAYYGDLMPNTYYAKNVGFDVVIEKGPPYLFRTIFVNLAERLPMAGVSVLLWLVALAGVSRPGLRRGGALVVPLFVLVQTIFALRTSGDWMQGWRYMMAVVPLWTLLIVGGIAEPVEAIEKLGKRAAGLAVAGASVVVFIGLCLWAAPEFQDHKEGAYSWAEQGWAMDARGLLRGFRMENTWRSADFLNKTIPAGATIAFSEMGATPYFTPGIRWLDTYGLTDRTIAHDTSLGKFRTGATGDYKDSNTAVGKHILGRRPDYIMQWLTSDIAMPPILNGVYTPFARTVLHDFDYGAPLTLQVWKRSR